jgi:hypothetical protein
MPRATRAGRRAYRSWSARCIVCAATLVVAFAAGAAAQPPAPQWSITGVVADETGGVLPAATLQLLATDGTVLQSTGADAAGGFRFNAIAAGRYEVRVTCAGFRPTTVRVTVGTRPPAALRVTLPLEHVTQAITVTNAAPTISTDAATNADTLAFSGDVLQSLPVFDQDVLGTVSQFLDAGSLGTGGVSLVVNGMVVNSLGVSASAIQQVKINADPYSAEYSRPGRGRIEILTKPGGQAFHGELSGTLRDAALDATNAFATTPPSEQRRIAEGSLGGPLGRTRSFFFSGQDDGDDQQAFIVATGLAGPIRDVAPVRNRHQLLSGSVTFQPSDRTTVSIRPSYEHTVNPNRGVGGTTLASAGWTYDHTEDDLTYQQQTVLNAHLIHQFQILVGYENEPTISASALPAVVVDGAFRGGGAQNTLLRTERHIQANDSLTWTHGHHLIQAGLQIPDWSLRHFADQTNAGGTFDFADLSAYAAGTPYAFTEQQGNGTVNWLEKVLGVYVKDDWQARAGLTLSLGLRYDWSNYYHDHDNVAPRLGAAYALGARDVLRGGAGVFYDKIGPFPVIDVLHSEPGGLQRFVLTNPGYPDPFSTVAAGAPAVPSLTEFAPDIQIPYTVQYSLGLEHQVVKGTTLALTYIGSRGSLLRSVDINAPMPPLYLSRPDPAYGQIRQIQSTGRQHSDSAQVTLRGKMARWASGQVQYTLSRTDNDSDGVTSFPANDYDLSAEWGRASFDRRHRLALLAQATAWTLADIGVVVTAQSGAPYSELLPGDPLNNGRGAARPADVVRNDLEGAAYTDVDLRLSRNIIMAKGTPHAKTMTIALDAFNALNHTNYLTYVGTVGSPLFGQPVSARAPRQLQISARLAF